MILQLLIAALVVWRVSTTIAVAKVFEPFRNWVWRERPGAPPPSRWNRARIWIREAVSCQFCLSHYVAFAYLQFWYVDVVPTTSRIVSFSITWMSVVALSSIIARACQKREPAVPSSLWTALELYIRAHTEKPPARLAPPQRTRPIAPVPDERPREIGEGPKLAA